MERPVAAGVLTMLGGFFILVGGAVIAVIGSLVSVVFGSFSSLWLVGLLLGGLTILLGLLMVAFPTPHSVWGVLAIVFAIGSIPFALGGFFVGFILAVLGGVLALRWRPAPPDRTITVEARTLL